MWSFDALDRKQARLLYLDQVDGLLFILNCHGKAQGHFVEVIFYLGRLGAQVLVDLGFPLFFKGSSTLGCFKGEVFEVDALHGKVWPGGIVLFCCIRSRFIVISHS